MDPILSIVSIPQWDQDDDTGSWFVIGKDDLLTATCPEHGNSVDYWPAPPDTTEFCPECEAWAASRRRKVAPGVEWSGTDEREHQAERAERDYFGRLER